MHQIIPEQSNVQIVAYNFCKLYCKKQMSLVKMFSANSKIIVSFVTLMSCLPIQVVKIVVAETFMQQLMHLIDRLSANWPLWKRNVPFLTFFFFLLNQIV